MIKRKRYFDKKKLFYGLTIINILIAFTLLFFRPILPFLKSAEVEFYGKTVWLKRELLKIDDRPAENEILYIDTHFANQLVECTETVGNELITDRQLLIAALDSIKSHKTEIKALICDINFTDSTVFDRTLIKLIQSLGSKIILPKDENNIFKSKLNLYYAEVDEIHGALVQYPLKYKNTYTFPVAIWKSINPNQELDLLPNWLPFIKINDNLYPSKLIIEPRIRPEHLDSKEYNYSSLNSFAEYFQISQIKNKIIIIGNFNENGNDKHQSILPYTYGGLAVLNTYLMIEAKDSTITLGWLIFMSLSLFIFFINQQMVFIPIFRHLKIFSMSKNQLFKFNLSFPLFNNFKEKISNFRKKASIKGTITFSDIFKIFLSLTTIALISYFVFGFHIEYFIISLIVPFEVLLYRIYLFIIFRTTNPD